jgi:hypothetical protein
VTPLLRRYLLLEADMMRLDDAGNEAAADDVRDRLDLIWDALSEAEVEWLNDRGALP